MHSVIEFNLFENMFSNSLCCSLVIVDQEQFSYEYAHLGQEFVSLKINNKRSRFFDFTKMFLVFTLKMQDKMQVWCSNI